MTERYTAYARYQSDGAIPVKLPSHWQVSPLCSVSRSVKDQGHADVPLLSVYLDRGVIPYSEGGGLVHKPSQDLSGYQLVQPGDFVLNNQQAWRGSVGVSVHRGIVSPAYLVLRLSTNLDSGYANYLFRTQLMADQYTMCSRGVGTIQRQIHRPTLRRCPVIVPPLDEQTQIAKFLDYETAKIDALIEKQQQLIALLKEKRQAVISHAVTKGLNPDAPMRDSGVEWLGEVPAHWRVGQLRRWIHEMEQGKSPECESRPAEGDEWGVLKTGCVNGGVYNADENKALPSHLSPTPALEVSAGDVLMSRASGSPDLIGSVGLVSKTRPHLMLSDKIFRLQLEPSVDASYFTHMMGGAYIRSLIVRAISGAAGMANNITKSSIAEFPVAIPPVDEQRAVAAHIDEISERVVGLSQHALLMQNTLSERRAALISAAVTGQIDVRSWKAPKSQPDEELV